MCACACMGVCVMICVCVMIFVTTSREGLNNILGEPDVLYYAGTKRDVRLANTEKPKEGKIGARQWKDRKSGQSRLHSCQILKLDIIFIKI